MAIATLPGPKTWTGYCAVKMDSVRSVRDDIGMAVLDERVCMPPLAAASQEQHPEVAGIAGAPIRGCLEGEDEATWSARGRSHDLRQSAPFAQAEID